MIHPLHEKYAKLLVEYCTSVQKGENVSINIDTPAEPMARAVVREVLRAGGNPVLHMNYPELMEDVLELAPDAYYDAEPTLALSEIKQIDAWIRVRRTSQ